MDIAVLDREIARQQTIYESLPILSDVTRSDVLYYDVRTPVQLVVAFHAQPHSIASLYSENRKDSALAPPPNSLLERAVRYGVHAQKLSASNGYAPMHQEVLPVRNPQGTIVGALSIESSAVEYNAFRHRGRALAQALYAFKESVARGDVKGSGNLTAFTARDGLLVVDHKLRIRYVSNIAEGFYHNLGVRQRLVGERIDALETGDEQLLWRAFAEGACLEQEDRVRDAIWLRRAIPLTPAGGPGGRPSALLPRKTALLLIRDVTLDRHQAANQVRLDAMIREIHHRVKNNLQTIVSLTRVEARRAQSEETKRALDELSNRIFAVAQVHESLSLDHESAIQLKDVARQIARQVRESLLPRDSKVSIDAEGDPLRLPPRQATAMALIINELVQNAVEHAFEPEEGGYVRIQLEDAPDHIRLAVVDSGRGLPEGLDWRNSPNLGLKIVQNLAKELHGAFEVRSQTAPARGLIAELKVSKVLPGGQ